MRTATIARLAATLALAAAAPAPARPDSLSPSPAKRGRVAEGASGPEDSIRGAPMKADVTWLADPARTGRGVGTPGNAAAAELIAGRLRALGLAPAGKE